MQPTHYIFVICIFLLCFHGNNAFVKKKVKKSHVPTNCSYYILSRSTNYYLGSTGAYRHFATLNYDYEKWCVLSTGHILNLNLNLYMYVYFGDVNNGAIQLIYLDLENYDGGDSAKWIIQQETGYVSIRPVLNQNYAVTAIFDPKNAMLETFKDGNIDQLWSIVPA